MGWRMESWSGARMYGHDSLTEKETQIKEQLGM